MRKSTKTKKRITKKRPRRSDSPTWTTRDGTTIKVSEMTDSHLANAMAMLLRQAETYRTIYAVIIGNTVDARDADDLEDFQFMARYHAPFRVLAKEAVRRGLRNMLTDVED